MNTIPVNLTFAGLQNYTQEYPSRTRGRSSAWRGGSSTSRASDHPVSRIGRASEGADPTTNSPQITLGTEPAVLSHTLKPLCQHLEPSYGSQGGRASTWRGGSRRGPGAYCPAIQIGGNRADHCANPSLGNLDSEPAALGTHTLLEHPHEKMQWGARAAPRRGGGTYLKGRGPTDSPEEKHGRENPEIAQHPGGHIEDIDPEDDSLAGDISTQTYSRYIPSVINDYRANTGKPNLLRIHILINPVNT